MLMRNQRVKQTYVTLEPVKKEILLEKKHKRDTANIHDLQWKRGQQYNNKIFDELKKKADRYQTMDATKKQDLLEKQKERYQTMEATI